MTRYHDAFAEAAIVGVSTGAAGSNGVAIWTGRERPPMVMPYAVAEGSARSKSPKTESIILFFFVAESLGGARSAADDVVPWC